MGLKFIFGGSGSGKSTYAFGELIRLAGQNPDKNYFVMVPDQFTMSAQKKLCALSPGGGIMNIDVQSFSRLIHRIGDELGQKRGAVLDDTGKNLVLRRVADLHEQELRYLNTKLKRPAYVHEVKSVLSEFYQYDIAVSDLTDMIASCEGKGLLAVKLKDLRTLYIGFREYIKEKFITSEEALDELCGMIPKSALLKKSTIVFDGFTGFTPIQLRVFKQLLAAAEDIYITLDADCMQDLEGDKEGQGLFALSAKTYQKLVSGAKELGISDIQTLFLDKKPVVRHKDKPELAFLESALFRTRPLVYRKMPSCIRIYEAQSLTDEIQNVCLKLRRLIRERGLHYRDIAVVSGDLGRYEQILRTEFHRYEIPYFMDQNRSVAANPLSEYMVSALSMLDGGFSYESVMRFLRCGLTSLTMDEADRLENYLISHGIRGKKAFTNAFTRGDDAQEMELIREKLAAEIAPLLGRAKTAGEYVRRLYLLLFENGLQKKCEALSEELAAAGELSKAKEYEKIYPACMELFDQIHELIGEDAMSLKEFIRILEAGISEIRIGSIPQNVDQVLVGDIERSRLDYVKVLFFVGVNDGVIPGKGSSGGLLSDMEREFLSAGGRELAPTPRQKLFQQRLYLYQNMTKPEEMLCLSYSKQDGSGNAILPSYLIHSIRGLFPALVVENDRQDEGDLLAGIETRQDGLDDLAELLRMYASAATDDAAGREVLLRDQLAALSKVYQGSGEYERLKEAAFYELKNPKLTEELARLLYGSHPSASISRAELFASCAYAHFLKYGLKLKERKEFEVEMVDFGSIYHAALDQILSGLKKQKRSLKELTNEQIATLVDEAMQQLENTYKEGLMQNTARDAHRARQMRNVLCRCLYTMRHQLAKGEFEPAYLEKSFRIDGDITISGKIDRIDLCEKNGKTYVKVVDYKTGEKKLDLSKLYYGLELQLPLYMSVALELLKRENPKAEPVPAAMLYSKLMFPVIKDSELSGDTEADGAAGQTAREELENKILEQMRLEGLTLQEDEVIASIDKDFQVHPDVIKVKTKKDGGFLKYSQICSREEFDIYMNYAGYKTRQLMEAALDGDIAVRPVCVGSDKENSCSYCAYHSVCGWDESLTGHGITKLDKLEAKKEAEVMRNEIDTGSAESR